jgi:hypothetical protein
MLDPAWLAYLDPDEFHRTMDRSPSNSSSPHDEAVGEEDLWIITTGGVPGRTTMPLISRLHRPVVRRLTSLDPG